ncbi:KTSC domain-containing protein [Rhizobium azibense]|uniref:KTSC domain-containing protein n=1 Tax=Rhizobium azibense TaxID=1136135 RepID=A0A4R3R7Q6_9HYPH|nr:KTSC domain-containing protein [Rhizobium azibense]TCU15449.1 KTSC domain-containing protein [Rhizobium azibense]TCU31280.1 KTSC domain-containing protein [Rhizobium azibense]
MKEIAVTSRIIESIFFNPDDGQLYIAFRNGETRLFAGVTEDAVSGMVTADSPGQHYIDHIRTQFRRVA